MYIKECNEHRNKTTVHQLPGFQILSVVKFQKGNSFLCSTGSIYL